MDAQKKRNSFIDELRGCAILLVVIGHILQFVIKVPLDGFAFAAIYSFHMPLFMFLAGYSLSLGHSDLKIAYVAKRMVCLFVSFFVWGGVMVYIVHNAGSLADVVLNPAYSLWFLWVLAWITFFVWFGQKISLRLKSEVGYALVILALAALDFVLDTWRFAFNLIATHCVFFVIGYKLKNYWSGRSADFKFFVKLCSALLFFTLILFWRFPQSFMLEKPVMTFLKESGFPRFVLIYVRVVFFVLKRYAVPLSGIVVVISFCQFLHKLLSQREKDLIAFLGTRTIDVYSMHIFIVCVSPCFLKNKWIDALVKFVLGIAIPLAVGSLLRKNVWTNFLFLAGKMPSVGRSHGSKNTKII